MDKKHRGALWLGRFKGGRKYLVNADNQVCFIECACCREIKPASAFHTNHFKKFNKQNYCIECNDLRLSGKSKRGMRQKRQGLKAVPVQPLPAVTVEKKSEPVFIYLIPFGGSKVYIGRTNNIVKRMGVHINNCKKGTHSSRFIQNRFNQEPAEVIDKFNKPIIVYVDLKGNRELACKKEREFIDHYIDKGFMVLGGKY